jgi:hypothetical protein
MWWEVYPFTNEMDFNGGTVQDCWPYDTIYFHATLSTTGNIAIHVVNEAQNTSYYGPTTAYSGDPQGTLSVLCGGQCRPDGHAEVMAEAIGSTQGFGLVHWSIPPWTNGVEFTERRGASPATGWKYFNQLSNYTNNIAVVGGHTLATPFPSGLGSLGDSPVWWVYRS